MLCHRQSKNFNVELKKKKKIENCAYIATVNNNTQNPSLFYMFCFMACALYNEDDEEGPTVHGEERDMIMNVFCPGTAFRPRRIQVISGLHISSEIHHFEILHSIFQNVLSCFLPVYIQCN